MIRVVDMREACDNNTAFALWDTVTDGFVEDSWGDQMWEGPYTFQKEFDEEFVNRVWPLLPPWAFE